MGREFFSTMIFSQIFLESIYMKPGNGNRATSAKFFLNVRSTMYGCRATAMRLPVSNLPVLSITPASAGPIAPVSGPPPQLPRPTLPAPACERRLLLVVPPQEAAFPVVQAQERRGPRATPPTERRQTYRRPPPSLYSWRPLHHELPLGDAAATNMRTPRPVHGRQVEPPAPLTSVSLKPEALLPVKYSKLLRTTRCLMKCLKDSLLNTDAYEGGPSGFILY
jgi:hypothetical protein